MIALLAAMSIVAAACGSDATELVDEATEAVEETAETVEETVEETAEAVEETVEDVVDGDEETDEAAAEEDDTDETTEEATETTGSANTADVAAAAEAFLATLSDDLLADAQYDFGDATITSGWSNLPACLGVDRTVERAGVELTELDDAQQTAFLDLAATVLSDERYEEFSQVRTGDDYLTDTLGNDVWNGQCYSMAVYGTPSATDAFAVQFGGHHIARMATYEGDTVTITPAFTGIEPGTFEVDGTTYDVMGDEMSAMFAMFAGLDDDQIAAAELSSAPETIVMGPGTDSPFPDTEGLAVSELTEDQQALVITAIEAFVNDFDSSVAATILADYTAALDETTIAWATAVDTETDNGYARIDGPNVWIEVSNEDGATGIHFHGIYRDKSGDYGDAA